MKDKSQYLQTYYSNIDVSQVRLPDSKKLTIYLDDKFIDTLLTSRNTILGITANKATKLSIYEPESKTLIGDTIVNIAPFKGNAYQVIYSPANNIAGFISAKGTSPDSVKIQVIPSLSQNLYPFEKVDIELFTYVNRQLADKVLTIAGAQMGKLDQRVFRLPRFFADRTAIFYAFRLKDPKTGNIIVQRAPGSDFFAFMNLNTA